MNHSTCSTCGYYKQHYAFDNRKIYRVYCGHCTYLRAKRKRPDARICENYIQGNPDEDAFVTKEFLSHTLLQYMMKLDLLPEIYDTARNLEEDTQK